MAGWSWPCGHPNWVRHQRQDQHQPQDPGPVETPEPAPVDSGPPKLPHGDLPETPFFDARDTQGQFTEEEG